MNNLDWLKKLDYNEYSLQKTPTNILLDLSLNDYEGTMSIFLPVLKDCVSSVGTYSFAQDRNLIDRIRKKLYSVSNDQILISAGADGALQRLLKAILSSESSKVCIPVPSFPRYEFHVKTNNRSIHFVESKEFPYKVDIDNLIKEAKVNNCDTLLISNPNNPTGMYYSLSDITKIIKNFKGYVIVDESLLFNGLKSVAHLTKDYERLFVVRTFSKLYGIAGERIGYIVGNSKSIKLIKRLFSPFEVSSVSLELAKKILDDEDTIETRIMELKNSIKFVLKNIPEGFQISPTSSSVFVIKSNKVDDLYSRLLEKGVKTVSCKDFRGIETSSVVRVSVKDLKSMQKLFSILDTL